MTFLGITWNYADLAIIGIVLLAAIIGFCRGIIINFINFIRLSVGAFLCFFTAENASQPVYEQWVKPKLLEAVSTRVNAAANMEEITDSLNSLTENLPPFIADSISYKGIDFSADSVADSIVNSVLEPVAITLIKAALFLGVFIVFFGITGLIVHAVYKHIRKKDKQRGHTTVLRKTDKLLGLLFGLLKAAVIVLAISAVLMYILELKPALAEENQFWQQISGSTLMQHIKEMNPFNAITEGYI